MARTALRGLFTRIEESAGAGWRWPILLGAWILTRNLIEGPLERSQTLGFDWRPELSAPMVFLHFPLFYLAVFLGGTLWLHLLSRRPLERVAGVVSAGFALLLVAPLIDALATGGRGADLGYLSRLGGTLGSFWRPDAAVAGVSVGQRIEIALACILAALYVWAAAPGGPLRRALAGLAGGAGLFLWSAVLGAWPSWLAGWTAPGAVSAEAAWQQVYRGFSLVPDESRRLAVVMGLPVLVLGPLFLGRLAPARWRAFLGSLSRSRLAHYTGMVPAGLFLGWWVYRQHLPGAFANAVDWAAAVMLYAAILAAYGAALLWNDLHDLAGDRINDPGRPVPSGLIDPREANAFAWTSAAAAAGLALTVSYAAFLLTLGCLVLAWLYSAPPVRLKRWPLAATLILGLLSLSSIWIGFALFAQEMTPRVFPGRIALLIVLGVALGFAAKDLKDAPGDRATGVITLATLCPERWARRLTAALVLAAYLLAPLCLPLGAGYWVAASGWGLIGAVLVLRRRRADELLLAGFLLFAVVTALFLAATPQARLAPDPLHARQRTPGGRAELERLAAAEPLQAEVWERLAQEAVAAGQAAVAVDLCDQALARGLRPGDFFRHRAAARLAGRDPAALPAVDRDLAAAWAFRGASAALRVLAGDRELLAGRLEEAAERYWAAIDLDDRQPDAWAGLGEARHAVADLLGAVAAFERAAALSPGDPWIRNNLGVALRDAERPEAAAAAFLHAADLGPELFEPAYNLGLLYGRMGRLDEAERWWRRAGQLRPGFPPVEQGLRELERLRRPVP